MYLLIYTNSYFCLKPHNDMILGIDIGGTNISFGLVEDGQVVFSKTVKSFGNDFTLEQTIDYLKTNIDAVITPEVSAIGIGVPSVVDVRTGTVYDTANIPSWKEVPLQSIFEKLYGCPVHVNNDSNCYALGVYSIFAGKSKPDSLVAMTLGTGVGIGVVVDGKLFCGANCGAGELSCLPYRDGTLEDYTGKCFFHSRGFDPRALAEEARGGNAEALAVFKEYGVHIGYAVSVILLAYDPEVIVLGGGVANNYPLFRESMFDYLKKHFPYRKTMENLVIEIATDNFIPVIGAASLI